MRTTIAIRDDLLAEAKRRAMDSHSTLSGFVEDMLRVALSRPKAAMHRSAKVRLPTFRGQGLRPGVDIDHSTALLDIMETR
jgi:Arc/MetJ family transcription regulator